MPRWRKKLAKRKARDAKERDRWYANLSEYDGSLRPAGIPYGALGVVLGVLGLAVVLGLLWLAGEVF